MNIIYNLNTFLNKKDEIIFNKVFIDMKNNKS